MKGPLRHRNRRRRDGEHGVLRRLSGLRPPALDPAMRRRLLRAGGWTAAILASFWLGRLASPAIAEARDEAAPELSPSSKNAAEKVANEAVASDEDRIHRGITSLPLALELVRNAQPGADGKLHARLPDGRDVTLTIEPELQAKTSRILKDYDVPWGASVAVEPSTGRILALAEHARDGDADDLVGTPFAPAASVFKIVTAAALLEAGVPASEEVCYSGGLRRLQPRHLEDSKRDHRCATMAEAMGHSTNAVFAKLAHKHLQPKALKEMAERLLFGKELSLEGATVPASQLSVPDDDPFAFATTAAGFNTGVRLTPLHGALLAAAIGNGGVLHPARIIDAIDGVPVQAEAAERILEPTVASSLGEMMELTVSEGTARRAFRDRRGPALPGIRVAGKTGSLFEREPFRDASWFVGFAPANDPSIAVSSVIVNREIWRIRAPYVAREALRSYLLGTSPYRPQ